MSKLDQDAAQLQDRVKSLLDNILEDRNIPEESSTVEASADTKN